MADHLEAGPHILQHLGGILPEFTQTAAAIGASIMIRHMRVDLTRTVLGERAAEGLRNNRLFRGGCVLLFDGVGGLEFFKLEFELFDLPEHLLAVRPEKHALQLVHQQFEPFDLAGA